MLRLNLKAAPRWLDIVPGVRFRVAPCSSTVMGLARDSEAVRTLYADDAMPSETEVSLAMAKEIGALTILDWEGVTDEAGAPAPVTPKTIAAALEVFPVFQAFQLSHVAAGLLLADEKNASAPSPTGTSAAARTIARPARGPAKRAPRKSTTPKR